MPKGPILAMAVVSDTHRGLSLQTLQHSTPFRAFQHDVDTIKSVLYNRNFTARTANSYSFNELSDITMPHCSEHYVTAPSYFLFYLGRVALSDSTL